MPYEGQFEPKVLRSTNSEPKQELVEVAETIKSQPAPQSQAEKLIAKPVKSSVRPLGKLKTGTESIDSILNPVLKKDAELERLPEMSESFTYDELKAVWHDYAYKMKRQKRDSFASTLLNSKLTMGSDYQIVLEINNMIQSTELEEEKVHLVRHLRSKLKNTKLGFSYVVSEVEKKTVMDSKSTFDKLAEENPALNKFRKLFNLDIEF